MNKYNNFYGIDIAKHSFVVAKHEQQSVKTYDNNLVGFSQFFEQHKAQLQSALVVLEATGGHEWDIIAYLHELKVSLHRADTLKVKRFIGSIRLFGKTDASDARILATYGYERQSTLSLFKPADEKHLNLQLLVRRRDELVAIRAQELNRSQSPLSKLLPATSSFSNILTALAAEIDSLEDSIRRLIESDSLYSAKLQLLIKMQGIGEISANKLLALIPELGLLTRKQIASLAGVAPHPYDSGQMNGYRSTRGGRPDVKDLLFVAALSASKTKSKLGDFYRSLLQRGKKKKVALIALARKMIVMLNAQMRDLIAEENGKALPA